MQINRSRIICHFSLFCLSFIFLMTGPADAVNVVFPDFSDTHQLTLNGHAAATTTADGVVLRLTSAVGNQAGSAFSTATLNAGAFSTFFAFRITEPGGSIFDCNAEAGADGFVFVIQSVSASIGSAGQGIGYAGIPTSIGIEFDTWCNGANNDPSSNHVGIDVDGNVNHGDGAPFTQIIRPDFDNGQIWYAWIDYDGSTLALRINQTPARPADAMLSRTVDIPTILGQNTAYVGFTSGTGLDWGNHDILQWEYRDAYNPISGDGYLCDLKSGLIAYYPFNGNANDASGNVQNGTVVNAVGAEDRCGVAGRAFQFTDGAYVQAPPIDLANGQQISISAWFKAEDTQGSVTNCCPDGECQRGWRTIISSANGKAGSCNPPTPLSYGSIGYWLALREGQLEFHLRNNQIPDTSNAVSIIAGTVSVGAWHHVVVQMSAVSGDAFAALWLDGEKIDEQPIESPTDYAKDTPMYIGSTYYDRRPCSIPCVLDYVNGQDGWSNFFMGILDDFRFFNRILTESEILAMQCLDCVCDGTGVELLDDLSIRFPSLTFQGTRYNIPLELEWWVNPDDPMGLYWRLKPSQ